MKVKKIASLILSGVLAASVLTGCGVDSNAVLATLDGEDITLGVPYFATRLQQAQYDDFYVAYAGESVWQTDMYGYGMTMEDTTKAEMITSIRDLYVLENHMADYGVSLSEEEMAAIQAAAAEFISDNSEEALEALGATEEIVAEYLELVTIQNKMYFAIVADADTEVSDEEANTSAYSYVRVSKTTRTTEEGESVAYTDEEKELLAKDMKAFAADVAEATLEEAAENHEYTVETGTFAADTTTLEEAVLTALQGLKEGQVSDLVETDNYYYVLRLDAATDAEATEAHRQSIIATRQSELYTEVLNGWTDAAEWDVDEKVWAKVKFDNLFTMSEETEAVADTEQ